MNIFVLDLEPVLCAHYHCNKHVCKLLIESAQILSTVHHLSNSSLILQNIYKPTHKNHPCVLWAAKCIENYKWLLELANQLCFEYTYRYNKIHKTQSVIKTLINQPLVPTLNQLTPFAQAMPVKYRNEDPVTAYRNYYIGEKKHFAKYTKRETPAWLN